MVARLDVDRLFAAMRTQAKVHELSAEVELAKRKVERSRRLQLSQRRSTGLGCDCSSFIFIYFICSSPQGCNGK